MRKLVFPLAALMFAGLSAPSEGAGVSTDFFYEHLSPYGSWREVGEYGYCWQPNNVADDWRPYGNGRWVCTDAGWTWNSAEPFSWAVYHYGRWAQLEGAGWVWVPGTAWGPAWVSWRAGKDYVGWAPLPPEARFNRASGFGDWVDEYYDIGPGCYVFVRARDFGNEHLNAVLVDRSQNPSIISQTENITRITYVGDVARNEGPRFEDVSRLSPVPVRRLKLERRQEASNQLRSRIEGNSLRVFAPAVDAKVTSPPKKIGEKVDPVVINHGWTNAGGPAQIKDLRTRMKGRSQPPAELPPRAVLEKTEALASLADKLPSAEKPPAPKPEKGTPGDMPPGTDSPAKSPMPALPAAEAPPAKPGPVEQPGASKPLPGETGQPPNSAPRGLPEVIDIPPASAGVAPNTAEAKPPMPMPPEDPPRPGMHQAPPVGKPEPHGQNLEGKTGNQPAGKTKTGESKP